MLLKKVIKNNKHLYNIKINILEVKKHGENKQI